MKKNLKSLMVVAFTFVLLLGLTGCGEQKENNGGGNGTQGGNQQQEQQGGSGTTAGEKWGNSDLTAYVPEPPLDKIGTVLTETKTTISYNTTWTPEEAKAYI